MKRASLTAIVRGAAPTIAMRRLCVDHRMARVRLAVFDIDGVLTDGKVHVGVEGTLTRSFDIKDGLGLVRLRRSGVRLAAISSSPSTVGIERLEQLGFETVEVGVKRKLPVLHQVCESLGATLKETSYMGDDIPDLECLRAVGLSCAPRDATMPVRAAADYVARHRGGRGAVRALAERILRQRSP